MPSRTAHKFVLASGLLLPIAFSSTAMSQTASGAFELEEITITATKRETSLQDTPMTVTALEGEAIQKSGRTTLAQILENVPGVEANTAGNFGQYFWVRGVGSSPQFGQDAAVTMSVNGVFQQSAQSTRSTFYDIDRVEVARGPQSTLQGRNALGGSISVISAEPKLDNEASATVGVGSNNEVSGQGMLNAPFAGDKMALRGSVSTEKRNGLLSNGSSDSDTLAGRLRWLIQPVDSFKVILSAETSRTGGRGVGSADSGLIIPSATEEFGLGRYCRNVTECATAVQTTGASSGQAGAGFANLPYVTNQYTTFTASDPYSRKFKSNTYYLDLNWDLGFANLYFQPTYIQSDATDYNSTFSLLNYAQWSERVTRLQPTWTTARQEVFARSMATGINWNHLKQDQKSAELRLTSPKDSKLEWLGGLYFFKNSEKVRTSATAAGTVGVYDTDPFGEPVAATYCVNGANVSPTVVKNPTTGAIISTPFGSGCSATNIPNDAVAVVRSFATNPDLYNVLNVLRPGIDPSRYSKDYAAYAQIKYPVTDALNLTGGGRLTRETKWRAAEPSRNTYRPDDGAAGTATSPSKAAAMPEQEITWNIFDFRFTADYKLNDDSMVYGSISSGFRGGSFQNVPVDANNVLLPGFQNFYDPEKLISYEVGTRNDLFNKRLRVNASVYYYDYRDYQYAYNALVYVGQDPDSLFNNFTVNAGKASTIGLDLETRFLLTERDELALNGSYIKSELGTLTLPGGNIVIPGTGGLTAQDQANLLKGKQLRRAPTWAISPSYRHRFDLGTAGSLTAGVDVHWEDKSFINNPSFNAGVNKLITQPSYHKSNLTLSYDSQDGKFNVSGFARNLEDKVTIGTIQGTPTIANTTLTNLQFDPSEGRTYGLTMTAKF